MIWLLPILIALVGGFLFASRKYTIIEKREMWDHHEIKSYTMTLRHSGGDLDTFDSEELGQGINLTVVNGQLTQARDLTGQTFAIDEFHQFTVEGLFKKAQWYPNVYYDPVYGFPQRFGSPWSWAIEVTNFQPNVGTGSWQHKYEDR